MSKERDDGELRDQFRRLRRQDEKESPPFSATRQAAVRRLQGRRRGPRRFWLAAAALSLALVAAMTPLHWLRLRVTGPVLPEDERIARLMSWRAPTESLLQTPENQLLRGVPRLGGAFLDDGYRDRNQGKRLRRP